MTRSLAPEPEEALATLRRVMSPTAVDQERVGMRLAAQLGAGVLGTEALTELSTMPKTAPPGWSTGLRGLGAQLVVASLIGAAGFGGGYLVGRGEAPSKTPSVESKTALAPSVGSVALPARAAASGGVSAERRSHEAPARSAAPSTASSVPNLSEVARELRRADRALRSGMPVLALSLLNDLDERVPRSTLGEERAAARLMARCLTRDPDAEEAATRWLERNPRSVYARRLRELCPLRTVTDVGTAPSATEPGNQESSRASEE